MLLQQNGVNESYLCQNQEDQKSLLDPEINKIILDECSTVVEIDHVRNLIDCLERKNG